VSALRQASRLPDAGDDRPELLEHLGEGALPAPHPTNAADPDRAGLTPWVLPVSLFDPLEPCSFAGERLFAVPSATTLVLVVFAVGGRWGRAGLRPRCAGRSRVLTQNPLEGFNPEPARGF